MNANGQVHCCVSYSDEGSCCGVAVTVAVTVAVAVSEKETGFV